MDWLRIERFFAIMAMVRIFVFKLSLLVLLSGCGDSRDVSGGDVVSLPESNPRLIVIGIDSSVNTQNEDVNKAIAGGLTAIAENCDFGSKVVVAEINGSSWPRPRVIFEITFPSRERLKVSEAKIATILRQVQYQVGEEMVREWRKATGKETSRTSPVTIVRDDGVPDILNFLNGATGQFRGIGKMQRTMILITSLAPDETLGDIKVSEDSIMGAPPVVDENGDLSPDGGMTRYVETLEPHLAIPPSIWSVKIFHFLDGVKAQNMKILGRFWSSLFRAVGIEYLGSDAFPVPSDSYKAFKEIFLSEQQEVQ